MLVATFNAIGSSSAFEGVTAGASLTRMLRPCVQAVLRRDARKYAYSGPASTPFDRLLYRAAVGVIFTPGERAIAIR